MRKLWMMSEKNLVEAIKCNRKTFTRRPIEPQPYGECRYEGTQGMKNTHFFLSKDDFDYTIAGIRECPYHINEPLGVISDSPMLIFILEKLPRIWNLIWRLLVSEWVIVENVRVDNMPWLREDWVWIIEFKRLTK